MIVTAPNFMAIAPEIFVLCMACVTLLTGVCVQQRFKRVSYLLAQLTLLGAALLTLVLFSHPHISTFSGLFVVDKVANILKLFIYITSFFVFIYSRDYIESRPVPFGEYYVLALLAILGMMVMVSASSLLSLYLGLELMSLPLYAMVALQRDAKASSEAAMKYFVMGALASGMMLYGMSMIYGATDSLQLTSIAQVIAHTPSQYSLIMIFGMVFLIVGLCFKLGAVPFHMWVPDVYQGAPTSVTAFIASAPKLAAYGILVRILIDAMPGFSHQWHQLLLVVAILSMALGNLVAIVQTSIKRMLAYSSIAHIGYMLLGFVAAQPFGFSASLFYMLSYSIMSVAAFGILALLSRTGVDVEHISSLSGLNKRNPWLAFIMLLIMFSMAGIPPLVGFFAKMGVLEAVIRAKMVWVAAVALLFAIIGAYYYLRVVKVMYFDEAQDATCINIPLDTRLAMSINGLAVLGLGLFPSGLISICRVAFGVPV